VSWPDDVYPAVNTDAQAEINRQLTSTCDIYVGILGSRFGTATPRAGSGTEEEFNEALARFRASPTSLRLLFYFKRAGHDPFTIDPEQLRQVQSFRKRLGDEGVLFNDFADTAQFTKFIDEHLHNLIVSEWDELRWRAKAALPSQAPVEVTPSLSVNPSTLPTPVVDHRDPAASDQQDSNPDGEEEGGLLDHVEGFLATAESLTATMNDLASHTVTFTHAIQERTADADGVVAEYKRMAGVGGSRVQQKFLAAARQSVDAAAADLDRYAEMVSATVKKYKQQSTLLFRYLTALRAENPAAIRQNQGSLAKMSSSIAAASGEVTAFQQILRDIPVLTGKFRRARRRAENVLGELIAELQISAKAASELAEEGPAAG
jgi:hypothetical protein